MTRKEFEQAVEAARASLIRRARRHRIGREGEDDLVQDAMLVALQKPEWQSILKVDCYLLQIMDNLVANFKRKTTAATGFDVQALIDAISRSSIDDLVDRMAYDQEIKEQVDAICAAAEAAGLTHSEAYVFYARLRGKEYDEIAKTMGLGRESCATYYSNALGKIRAHIKTTVAGFDVWNKRRGECSKENENAS